MPPPAHRLEKGSNHNSLSATRISVESPYLEATVPALYESKAIANFFLRRQRLTQMKLHKLVYFAHGWHLGLNRGPLLDEAIQAWRYGPVVPSLYEEFKWFGPEPIDCLATRKSGRRALAPTVDPDDTFVLNLLERIWDLYGPLSAARLSRMTHEPDSPWTTVAGGRRRPGRVDMPDGLLAAYLGRRVLENRRARQERSGA